MTDYRSSLESHLPWYSVEYVMPFEHSRGVSRRDFVKAAVAIGGSAALAACQDRERSMMSETPSDTGSGEFPSGRDPTELPRRQHAWNEYMVHDAHGNTTMPQHQLVLLLDYVGSTPPTPADRQAVARAMDTLDRAVQWGTGGRADASINSGILSMLGYSPAYFSRLDASVEGLTPPGDVLEAVGEDPGKADDYDALLIVSSDFGSLVLAAEQALFGERETINGVEMPATFEGVFEKAERRTGVVGKGIVPEELDNEDVPDAAPLSMGYRSGFADNQAPESRVTIQEGPFAGGTMLANSRLHIDLDRWYAQDTAERAGQMFCPAHDVDEIGDTASSLGSSSRITPEDAESIPEDARQYGVVGHSQKVATARDDGFAPRILRRSEGVATDVADGAGFNFNSIQRRIQAFVDARQAMNPEEYDVDVPADDSGIVDFLETRARGTYLVPPRDRRALPEV